MSNTSLTIKAKKNGKTVTQKATSAEQKKRWLDLFEKNGYRIVTGKGL